VQRLAAQQRSLYNAVKSSSAAPQASKASRRSDDALAAKILRDVRELQSSLTHLQPRPAAAAAAADEVEKEEDVLLQQAVASTSNMPWAHQLVAPVVIRDSHLAMHAEDLDAQVSALLSREALHSSASAGTLLAGAREASHQRRRRKLLRGSSAVRNKAGAAQLARRNRQQWNRVLGLASSTTTPARMKKKQKQNSRRSKKLRQTQQLLQQLQASTVETVTLADVNADDAMLDALESSAAV
jgi:hypothetical protein